MDKKVNFISYLLLSLAVLMTCISGLLTIKIIDDMKKDVKGLREQNETLIYENELQANELKEIKSFHATYASETDAKLKLLSGEIQEMRLEKEANEVELHKVAEPQRKYLGEYELTAYAWTGNPCSNGNYPTQNYTVACNSLPLGTKIHIEGYGDYVVEDRGGMSNSVIDVYMGDTATCIQFGRRSAKVYIYE